MSNSTIPQKRFAEDTSDDPNDCQRLRATEDTAQNSDSDDPNDYPKIRANVDTPQNSDVPSSSGSGVKKEEDSMELLRVKKEELQDVKTRLQIRETEALRESLAGKPPFCTHCAVLQRDVSRHQKRVKETLDLLKLRLQREEEENDLRICLEGRLNKALAQVSFYQNVLKFAGEGLVREADREIQWD